MYPFRCVRTQMSDRGYVSTFGRKGIQPKRQEGDLTQGCHIICERLEGQAESCQDKIIRRDGRFRFLGFHQPDERLVIRLVIFLWSCLFVPPGDLESVTVPVVEWLELFPSVPAGHNCTVSLP